MRLPPTPTPHYPADLLLQARLWEAVEAGSLRGALAALAGGAAINAPYRTPRAQRLVDETGELQVRVPLCAWQTYVAGQVLAGHVY